MKNNSNENSLGFQGLTGNQLKIIALITMTVDHIGVQIFPELTILRIIGRIAFPIFAFMIAEGCRYTRNRKKYLLSLSSVALLCQIIYFIAMRSLYQCVMVTFSLAVIIIYALDNAQKKRTLLSWCLLALSLTATVFLCLILPLLMNDTNFAIDYGIFGVMLPVAIYLGKDKISQLCLAGIFMFWLCLYLQETQWFSLLTLPLLAMYNGKRGKLKLKSLFYIYYPLHLGVIYLISLLIFK